MQRLDKLFLKSYYLLFGSLEPNLRDVKSCEPAQRCSIRACAIFVSAQKGSIRAFVMVVCMRMRGNIRAFDGNDRLHAKITSPLPIGTYIYIFFFFRGNCLVR